MRLSKVLALAAPLLFGSQQHFAFAEEASFTIDEAKYAEAQAELENQYILTFKGGEKGAKVLQKLSNGTFDGVELVKVIGGRIAVVKFDSDAASAEFTAAASVGIANFEKDALVYIETPKESNLRRAQAQVTPYGIGHVKAEQVSDDNIANQKICIVDSGYNLAHEDLIDDPALVTGTGFVGSWDADGNGHGTHVAGTILAIDNSLGVKGVIRNGQVPLHIGRVFNALGFGSTSNVIDALVDCVDVGATVVNMSLGGGGYTQTFQDEINTAWEQGTLVVAASGNSPNGLCNYPACYDKVLAVASIDEQYQRSSFSSYNDEVDICAPGSAVYSTYKANSYATLSGTSMACPHVAGVAALVWSHNPSLPIGDLAQLLMDTATDLGTPGYDIYYGNGLVDAKAAFDALPGGDDCFDVQVLVRTDANADQTSWEIVDSSSTVIASKDDFTEANSIYTDSVCLPIVDGCPSSEYTFTISDSGGDGFSGAGNYFVLVEGEVVSDGSPLTGSSASVDLPSCASDGVDCLDYSTGPTCRDTDGCFFYQGNCLFCAVLTQGQCNQVNSCTWTGSSCE